MDNYPLQRVWTQISTNRMWFLIWIQTIWHSDKVSERIVSIFFFWKKSQQTTRKHEKLPSMKRVKIISRRMLFKGILSLIEHIKSWRIIYILNIKRNGHKFALNLNGGIGNVVFLKNKAKKTYVKSKKWINKWKMIIS